jgi:hypothetical protein
MTIWENEKDELIYDERLGAAHLTDEDMAGATAESTLLPGARRDLRLVLSLHDPAVDREPHDQSRHRAEK